MTKVQGSDPPRGGRAPAPCSSPARPAPARSSRRARSTPAARAPRKPFVALNCAALTESLLENELFGHARGAFTGAAGARAGPHRARRRRHAVPRRDRHDADGAAGQAAARARIRRGAAHRRERERGASTSASSPRPTSICRRAVDAGAFRSDLFYRLNVHRVHMPPLRERDGDVPLLRRALPRALRPRRRASTGVAAPAMAALAAYRLSRQRPAARTHHPARRRRWRSRPSSMPGRSAGGAAATEPAVRAGVRKARSPPRASAPSAR